MDTKLVSCCYFHKRTPIVVTCKNDKNVNPQHIISDFKASWRNICWYYPFSLYPPLIHPYIYIYTYILYICVCVWIHKRPCLICLYNDVVMSTMASQITCIICLTFAPVQIKGCIKAPSQWPLWGESTGDRLIPLTKDQLLGKCFRLMTSSSNMENCNTYLQHPSHRKSKLSCIEQVLISFSIRYSDTTPMHELHEW